MPPQAMVSLANFARQNNWGVFILLSIFYYLSLAYAGMPNTLGATIVANVFAGFILWLLLTREEWRDHNIRSSFLTIFVISAVLPLIVTSFDGFKGNAFVVNYLVNPVVMMWWTYWAILNSPDQGIICWLAKRLFVLWILGLAILFVLTTAYLDQYQVTVTDEMRSAGFQLFSKSYYALKDTTIKAYTGVKSGATRWWNLNIQKATGDYYTGKVENNQKEQLGVYLTNLKPTDPYFYLGDTPLIWATIKARSLDDDIDMNNTCYSGEKRDDGTLSGSTGIVDPQFIKDVYGPEQYDIECRFPHSDELREEPLAVGTNQVTVQTDFNFQTMAYIKRYFINDDRFKNMNRQGIDPLDTYKITDKKPQAVFTNGPVALGMQRVDDNPLIAVKSSPGTELRYGVTVERNPLWKGGIKEIKQIIIEVPSSIVLKNPEVDCNYPFKEYSDSDCLRDHEKYQSKQYKDCRDSSDPDCVSKICKSLSDGYRAYEIDFSKTGPLQNIKEYKTFSCKFTVTSPEGLLGETPIATKYFRSTARYIYYVDEKVGVVIKEDPVAQQQRQEAAAYQAKATKIPNAALQKIYVDYEEALTQGTDFFSACEMSALIMMESGGIPTARPAKGESTAVGILQFIASTAAKYDLCSQSGTDYCKEWDHRTDAKKSIMAGYQYISDINGRLGNKVTDGDRSIFLMNGFFMGEGCMLKILTMTGKSPASWTDYRSALTVQNMMSCSDLYRKKGATWVQQQIATMDGRVTNFKKYTESCKSYVPVIEQIQSAPAAIKTPSVAGGVSRSVQKGTAINDLEGTLGLSILVEDVYVHPEIGTEVIEVPVDYNNFVKLKITDIKHPARAARSVTIPQGEEILAYPLLAIKASQFSQGSANLEITAHDDFTVTFPTMVRDQNQYLGASLQAKYSGSVISIMDSKHNKEVCSVPWKDDSLVTACSQALPGTLTVRNNKIGENIEGTGTASVTIDYKRGERPPVIDTVPDAGAGTDYSLDGISTPGS